MTGLGSRMKAIRNKLGWTQDKMADKMGQYKKSTYNRYENEVRPITQQIIDKFKEVVNIPYLPLTLEDEVTLVDTLYKWMNTIIYGETDVATEQMPVLEKAVDYSTQDNTLLLYQLFKAGYYRATGKLAALNDIMTALEPKATELNDELSYWYYRQKGLMEMLKLDNVAAHEMFTIAERYGTKMKLNDDTLYYNWGRCLTNMGYAGRAVEYLELAKELTVKKNDTTYGASIWNLLIDNYIQIGRTDNALDILYNCLRDEKQKNKTGNKISLIHRRFSRVYMHLGKYKEALESINTAIDRCERKSLTHKLNLYVKATILYATNDTKTGLECVEEGLIIQSQHEIHNVLFLTLKHLNMINENDSLKYIVNIAIPELINHSKNFQLIDCYMTLSNHFLPKNPRESQKNAIMAFTLSEKLRKGNVS
jgi:transcriptional regulator with XRE-family HTH domain/predicted negative regulator of RcsB-dependent stress response